MSFAGMDSGDSFGGLLDSRISLLLTKISNFFTEHKVESYLVGGLVRDVLSGRGTADIDIAVAADALEIAPELADALGGKYVLLDKVNRVGRVILADDEAPSPRGQWELDLSTLEGSIEPDLARRDFTIDAMAIDLDQLRDNFSEVQLIDPFNGRDDLRQGVIRAVTDTAFESDAARLLRAVRLAAEFGFSIDDKTEALIRRSASLLARVAGERIREELLRLLAIPAGGQLLPYLDELGLLTVIFPELGETKGVEQPKEHFWNVFDHSLRTVIAVDFLLRRGNWEYAGEEVRDIVPWSAVLAQHFEQEVSSGSTRRSLLRLAALLHDVAKPQTKAEVGGRIRFLGHAKDGAAMVADRLEILRFSGKETGLVETLVRHHLRPSQMSRDELPTRRAIYRYFRDTGEASIDVLFLSLADHLATRGPNLDISNWQAHAQVVEYVLSQLFEQESITSPPKLIDGRDLINIFNMSPGPRIGEILEAVREAQASGEVTSREEALSLANRLLTSPRSLIGNKG